MSNRAKIYEYDILRNIWGIELSKKFKKLEPFIFQKSSNGIKALSKRCRVNSLIAPRMVSEYSVRCKVKASSSEQAVEIADECFKKLEYIFALILGRKGSGHEVRILGQTREISLYYIARRNDGEISVGAEKKMVHIKELI